MTVWEHPLIAGDVRRVLETYVKGLLLSEDFKMPGCGKTICCRGQIRHGQQISNSPTTRFVAVVAVIDRQNKGEQILKTSWRPVLVGTGLW